MILHGSRIFFLIGLVVAVAGFSGCKKPVPSFVPVSGTVTINGKPLGNAEVRFVPLVEDLDANFICSAITADDGSYTLMPPGKSESGCCACKNKVLIAEGGAPDEAYAAYMKGDPQPMEKFNRSLKNRPIPTAYGRMSSSPLTITVTPEQTVYDLELSR